MEHGNGLNICQGYSKWVYGHIPAVKYSAAVKNEQIVFEAVLDEKSKLWKNTCDSNVNINNY